MGILTILTAIRLPLLLSRLLPKGNIVQNMCFSLRPDPQIHRKSIEEVLITCTIELVLLPIVLLEMVILELTVYRYPKHFAGIMFSVDLVDAWEEVNTCFWALLADIPLACLCVIVSPMLWRSVKLGNSLCNGTLTSAKVAAEIVAGVMDILAALGLVLVYVTIVRIALYHALYRKYSQRIPSRCSSPFQCAAFEAVFQLPLDFLSIPLFLALLIVPWHIPAAYQAVLTSDSPCKQRKVPIGLVLQGGFELGHVVLLGICVILTPWLLISSRNFVKMREMDKCAKVRFVAMISIAEIPNLVCFLVACAALVSTKKAFFAFFQPIKGENIAEIEHYLNQRRAALAYYALTSAFFLLSILLQSLLLITLWRVPTLLYIGTHFSSVLPEFKQRLGLSKGNSAAKSFNPLLRRSKLIDYFIGGSLVIFTEWLKDLVYCPFLLLTPPWRLLIWYKEVRNTPFSLAQQKLHRRALLWSSRTGCLDVASVFASIVIVISLWRLPFFIKLLRKNAHLGYKKTTEAKEYLSYHYCVLVTIREWGKDLFFLPISILLSVISPWRIPQIVTILIGKAERIPTIKAYKSISSQRIQLFRMVISVVFFDYPALLMALILLITGWRALFTLNIIKIHAFKYITGIAEEVDSTLFREILGQFVQLWIDIIALVLTITVLICGVRSRHISRRLRRYIVLHRERKGYQYQLILKGWFGAALPPLQGGKKGICSLSRNALWEICSMLELADVGKLQCVCTYLARAIDYKPIWRYQYLHNYCKYLEKATFKRVVQAEFNYKLLAVEAYREYRKIGRELSEEERDYMLGVRAIVLEEAVLTVLNLPDLILLPGKCVAFLLYSLPFERYAGNQQLFLRSSFETGILLPPYIPYSHFANGIIDYHPEYRLSLSTVHFNLVQQCSWIFLFSLELMTWISIHFDVLMIKMLSGFAYYSPLNQAISGVRLGSPRGLWLLQGLQIGWMLVNGGVKAGLTLLPAGICWKLSNYSLIGCVMGPWCLHLLWYAVIFANVSTLFHLRDHFPYYTPWTSLGQSINFTLHLAQKAFNAYTSFFDYIADFLIQTLQFTSNLLQKLLSLASQSLSDVLRLLISVIFSIETALF